MFDDKEKMPTKDVPGMNATQLETHSVEILSIVALVEMHSIIELSQVASEAAALLRTF
jgi:hypothetical protein